jgi:DNA-binding MarR family transcriptional regulator
LCDSPFAEELKETPVSLQSPSIEPIRNEYLGRYQEALSLLERLHRLMLDVVKDEFERLGIVEINPVQGLLLFNIGTHEVTAGELKSRGYYQGSNVSYNLKKLVEEGYMHHQRCPVDRRAVRVRLTPKGIQIQSHIAKLFERHSSTLANQGIVDFTALDQTVRQLRRIERFWGDQIRYIY